MASRNLGFDEEGVQGEIQAKENKTILILLLSIFTGFGLRLKMTQGGGRFSCFRAIKKYRASFIVRVITGTQSL